MVLALTPAEKHRQRQQQKAWREANPEKVKAHYNFHRSRPEHRARIKAWHLEHKDLINWQARERYRLRRLAKPADCQSDSSAEIVEVVD